MTDTFVLCVLQNLDIFNRWWHFSKFSIRSIMNSLFWTLSFDTHQYSTWQLLSLFILDLDWGAFCTSLRLILLRPAWVCLLTLLLFKVDYAGLLILLCTSEVSEVLVKLADSFLWYIPEVLDRLDVQFDCDALQLFFFFERELWLILLLRQRSVICVSSNPYVKGIQYLSSLLFCLFLFFAFAGLVIIY